MKKYILPVLLLAAVQGFAQKISDDDINFEYRKLPAEPLGKSFTNYQSKVELMYASANSSKKADMEEKYKKDMAKYEDDKKTLAQRRADAEAKFKEEDKIAEDRYQKELAEWNKKSAVQKLASKKLDNEGKPQKQYVPHNIPPDPSEPYKPTFTAAEGQKDYDVNLLANTYLIMEGFKNTPDNAVLVTASVGAFDCIKPQLKTVTKAMTHIVNGKSTPYNQNYYHWETSYKQPMSVKVEVPGRGVVFNQGIEQFNQYTLLSTPETDQYPQMDPNSYVVTLQDKIMADNMKYINQLVNDKYGFAKFKRTTTLYNVKPKGDNNYDDYQSAYENATAGYNMLASDAAGGKAKMKTAIANWEKALEEYKPGEKKARINDDVMISTRINLAEAYMWTDDYVKADEQLIKINSLDPSRHQRKWAEEFKPLLADQKKRFESNQ